MDVFFLEQPQQIQIMREKLGIPEPREGLHRFFVLGGCFLHAAAHRHKHMMLHYSRQATEHALVAQHTSPT